MKRRFTLSPEAESDLDEIRDWVIAEGGPRAALCVIHSLLKAIRLLARRPQLGHNRSNLTDLPVKFWPVFSYLVVYDPARCPIEIVRVLHGARNLAQMLSGSGLAHKLLVAHKVGKLPIKSIGLHEAEITPFRLSLSDSEQRRYAVNVFLAFHFIP